MQVDIILEANNPPETVVKLGKLAEEYGFGGVWVSNMNDARDPFNNFVDLWVQQRFATGNGNNGRTTFIDRMETLFGCQLLAKSFRGMLNFAAAGTSQITLE